MSWLLSKKHYVSRLPYDLERRSNFIRYGCYGRFPTSFDRSSHHQHSISNRHQHGGHVRIVGHGAVEILNSGGREGRPTVPSSGIARSDAGCCRLHGNLKLNALIGDGKGDGIT